MYKTHGDPGGVVRKSERSDDESPDELLLNRLLVQLVDRLEFVPDEAPELMDDEELQSETKHEPVCDSSGLLTRVW